MLKLAMIKSMRWKFTTGTTTFITNWLTHSMEHSPSWIANNHSASQEIPHLLWNPTVHYRAHKSPPLVSVLSQMHEFHILPPYFPKIHSNISSHLRLDLPSGLFPSRFPTKILCAYIMSHACYIFRSSHPWFGHEGNSNINRTFFL